MAFRRTGLATLAIALGFTLWHAPLLTPHAVLRGLTSDSAILGLMAKRMLEGRGFDVFFWGQNYLGPFTSIVTAAWGAVLGGVGPLALRVAIFTIVIGAIVLTEWGVRRIDPRAAAATAAALAITPPTILRMIITPLGAEMALFFSAALLAVALQHLTAPQGAGWLSHRGGQVAFGVLAGIAWWMNQQVVFVLFAVAGGLAWRSASVRAFMAGVSLRDRLRFRSAALGWRPMPGAVEAAAWTLEVAGLLLLGTYIVRDVAGLPAFPSFFSPSRDACILIVLPHIVLPLVLGEWRRWNLRFVAASELAALARFGAGAVVGYTPVWLGGIAGWYERSYTIGLSMSSPREIVEKLRELPDTIEVWVGISRGPLGVFVAIGFLWLAIAGLKTARDAARLTLALIPLANLAVYLGASGTKHHYLITSAGPLLAIAALGGCHLWDTRRRTWRAATIIVAIATALSMGSTAIRWHRDLASEPDPMPLLARVEETRCAVVYADFWIAYRYRFLDGERRAWIPYRSQNRTKTESRRMQQLPGRRCLIGPDGSVATVPRDLPLEWAPPRPSVAPAAEPNPQIR